MKLIDIDITNTIRSVLPIKSILFNPSIAHLNEDTFLVSVRSVLNDRSKPLDLNPRLRNNPQHPWSSHWKGVPGKQEDKSYILPLTITDKLQPVAEKGWPLIIDAQDLRIFRMGRYENQVVYILTFNVNIENAKDLYIKGGDSCDDWCYLIGWSYLLVNAETLEYAHIQGDKPLCLNISKTIEKNWSLWTYTTDDLLHLMVSYTLVPQHTAFSWLLRRVAGDKIVGGQFCELSTPRREKPNFLENLQQFYDRQLFVSLSTPAYPIEDGIYQAIGHIKVSRDYLRTLAKTSSLGKFAAGLDSTAYFHEKYIYFMFLYRFSLQGVIVSDKPDAVELSADVIGGEANRISAKILSVSPAFVLHVNKYNYYLNFPAGQAIVDDMTIISYGDGDFSSHLLYIDNTELVKFMKSTKNLKPERYPFITATRDERGQIRL